MVSPASACAVDPKRSAHTVVANASDGGVMTSMPPMKGRSASGTVTLPSASWQFSRIATTSRGTAAAVAFSVCKYCVGAFFALPPPALDFPPFAGLPLVPLAVELVSQLAGGGAGRKRILRAAKVAHWLHYERSTHLTGSKVCVTES